MKELKTVKELLEGAMVYAVWDYQEGYKRRNSRIGNSQDQDSQ